MYENIRWDKIEYNLFDVVWSSQNPYFHNNVFNNIQLLTYWHKGSIVYQLYTESSSEYQPYIK